jgi:hypothetical protein
MRSLLLLSICAFSSLSTADPIPRPEPEYAELESREAQLPQIIGGQLLGGLIGLGVVAGALNSFGKGYQACKCPMPRCEGANACECINSAAVSCWVQAKGECQLSLNTCRSDPNAPPTDPRSQFPPCLPNGGVNSALPPCQASSRCAKVDNNCYDWNFRAQGGCIGICVPRNIGTTAPKATTPQQPKGGNWGNQPQQTQPKGGNWGNQPQQPKGGNWGNQQGGNGGAWQPQPKGPQGQQGGGPPFYGECPAAVRSRCPGNSICVLPSPLNRDTFVCAPANEICTANAPCSNGRVCVADPRTQCTSVGCAGLCA